MSDAKPAKPESRGKVFLFYTLSTTPGWILIGLFLYVYWFSQRRLIENEGLLIVILVVGVALSFLCASVEMALASFADDKLTTLKEEGLEILTMRSNKSITEQVYLERHKNILDMMLLYYKADQLNAPIVIFNNIVNTLIASLLPLAFVPSTTSTPVPTLPFIGITIPFHGEEMLTFTVTTFFIVLLGEVVPKKLGRKYSLGFLRRTLWFIHIINVVLWPLSRSFLSVVEIPSKLRQLMLGLPIE